MAPLVQAFKADPRFETRVCVTAQHREMLDQVLEFFDITPEYDLDLMKPGQNLYGLTAAIITNLQPVLEEFKPDYVYVHGDTTTTMAGSIAAFYSGAQVCHVEAGLRTHNKRSPFPEEVNRNITGRIADYHFAPTTTSQHNLLNEGVAQADILVTGNTVIDALLESAKRVDGHFQNAEITKLKNLVVADRRVILVTGHRRENHGQGFENICAALGQLAQDNPQVDIIYPVHLNPKVLEPVHRLLGNHTNVHLIEPLGYPAFVWLMNKSYLIITDSGGVQEEAPSLGKPVLVMRDTTERPEAVDAGTVLLVGTDVEKITSHAQRLLDHDVEYKNMSQQHNPYGDGQACERIVNFIADLDEQ